MVNGQNRMKRKGESLMEITELTVHELQDKINNKEITLGLMKKNQMLMHLLQHIQKKQEMKHKKLMKMEEKAFYLEFQQESKTIFV